MRKRWLAALGAGIALGSRIAWRPRVAAITESHLPGGFQYAGPAHQAETALAGMWLFLATELLFFGGLFLIAFSYWRTAWPAIVAASAHTEFGVGTVNTAILLCSSAIYTLGVGFARQARANALLWCAVATALLGAGFLALKGYEWHQDFAEHLFPGADFQIVGAARGGARIFWSFYFLATFLHALHMVVGIGLVAWVALSARRDRVRITTVENIGLYWSFVDMMWLCLYPLIYLPGRGV